LTRLQTLGGVATLALLGLVSGFSAQAQTAQYAGAQITLSSAFDGPYGVAVDSAGDVFVTDAFENTVSELLAVNGSVPASPTIRILGSGFNTPIGVAVDASGNVYVADAGNQLVKEIEAVNGSVPTTPTIRTLGTGFNTPIGVALDASGDLFVSDAGTNSAYEILAVNGTIPVSPTVNTLANTFSAPFGIAVDASGNVYVADSGNNVIDEILAVNGTIPASPTIQTVGSGFSSPYGVAVDASGDVYLTQANSSGEVDEILAVNGSIPTSPTILPVGGGFSAPVGVAVDANGSVFVADAGNDDVAEVVMGAVKFGTINIGSHSPAVTFNFTFLTGGTISAPAVLTQGSPSLDFSDSGAGTCTGNGSSYVYDAGDVCAVSVVFTPTFAGSRNGAVQLKDSNGNVIASVYANGTGSGPQVGFSSVAQSSVVSGLSSPSGVAVDGSGNLYIVDSSNYRVLKETLSAGIYSQSAIGSGLSAPSGVALDAAGNVYIADSSNQRVVKETLSAGVYTQSVLASGLSSIPQGIAVDGSGNVYVAENAVIKLTPANGSYTQSTLNTQGLNVNWLALDGQGNIFLVDSNASEVISMSLSGQNSQSASVGSGFSDPSGIAVDAVGNIYISDELNNRVVKETLQNGSYAQSVLPTGTLKSPTGLAVASNGNVFVADQSNVVWKEDVADVPTLTYPTATAAGTTDSTDGALTVGLLNLGNAPLTGGLAVSSSFTQVSGSGNPADCTATLSLVAGAACNLSLEFTPVATAPAGAVTGTAVFTDNNLNASPSTTQTINLNGTAVAAAAATHFAVTSTKSTVAAGAAFSITITAEDASNNTVTGYSGSVALTSTDAQFSGTGNVPLSSGTGTFQVTLATVGTQTITATSTSGASLTGSVQVTVQPGVAAAASVVAGSNQSAPINSAFTTQLQLLVVDAYGNPVPGASVLFVAPTSGASASFSVPATSANQTAATTGANGIATASIATANSITGQYNVAASVGSTTIVPVNFLLTNTPASQYLVTVLADDAGNGSNCIDQANGSGDNSNCSLRDAVTAINALTGTASSTISFAPALTAGGPQTITLANGQITLANNVTVNGPGANLLSISGGGVSQILAVNSGVTATVSGLTFTSASAGNGASGGAISNGGNLSISNSSITGNTIVNGGSGAGVYNSSVLTVSNSNISGNSAPGSGFGGGIFNASNGSATVVNSTISGNTTANGGGSGIYNDAAGVLSVVNTTVSGNSDTAGGQGGGIYSKSSTLTLENSIVAGNSATGSYADLDVTSGFTPDNSNLAGTDPGTTSLITAGLAPLSNYGGTTPSLIPLPGSPAICNGAVANIPSGVTTDQRGTPRTTTYASTACVDAGAVQTNYSLIFVQQPTDTSVGTSITPAPTVELNENGAAFAAGSSTIALTLSGNGILTGGSAATANGIATYSAASISALGTGDTLKASLVLNSTTSISISTTSNTFDVAGGTSQLAFGTPPAANVTNGGNAGSAITVQEENASGTVVTTATDTITLTVSGPNSYSQTYTAVAVNGVATFNLGSAALTTNGLYLYLASSGTLTDAQVNETVSQAAADTITILSGSGQSATIGSAFTQALTVKVLDASNNPVSGATVSFAAPASGASASLSALTATTASNGTASVMATANGTASVNPYSVVATVTGNAASFSLTNTQAASSLTVTPSATGLVYGQPVTIKATISPAAVLTVAPTGSITFYDGTTALIPVVTVTAASGSDTIAVPTTGSHTYGAQYGGDASFSATSLKAATNPVVVGKASATLNGPSKQPVSFPVGTVGTTQVTLVGQFAGTGISQPGGTVSYTVNGTNETATITNGTATLTFPSTWPVGSYSVMVSYAGDGNYTGAPSITVPFSVTAAAATSTTTVLKASATTVAFGSSVALTATVAASTGSTVPSGSVTFTSGTTALGTAALNATGVATYAATTLPVGTDSITASYQGSASFATSVSSVVKVTVTSLATTTTLATSNANASAGTAVTFTATVAPKTPVPTGTVTFNDGTKALGTGTVSSSGVATYATSTLAAGTHSVTAVYAGDADHAGSTSSVLTETISTATAPPASFTLTAKSTSLSIQQGSSGTVSLTLTAVNGFSEAVTLSCSGLPANSTCTVPSPSTPTAAGTATSVTINTDTTATTAQLKPDAESLAPKSGSMTALAGAGLAGLALLFGIPARKRLGRFSSFYSILMAVLLSGALASVSIGCGGGSNSSNTPTTPVGTSTVTVSATAGSGATAITQTVSVKVTVSE
jgi:sugar lactone lactonase YvrE